VAASPDGKASKAAPVAFTRQAAERISRAVLQVEAGDRTAESLRFGRVAGGLGAKVFRVCTFTGAWTKNTLKTVTFRNQTSTPNTVSATNLFANVPSGGNCAIARDGTAWYLIAAECG
jgi:hypothetical protein